MDKQQKLSEDDKVIFIPEEEARAIKSICEKIEQAQQEFHKVAEGMKLINYKE
jgi:hypothetical protein